MYITYNSIRLAKHDITQTEIDQIMRNDVTIERSLSPSKRGNERLMLVGFTLQGRLLEIGIEFFTEEERMHIFHGNDATKRYRHEFEKVRQ